MFCSMSPGCEVGIRNRGMYNASYSHCKLGSNRDACTHTACYGLLVDGLKTCSEFAAELRVRTLEGGGRGDCAISNSNTSRVFVCRQRLGTGLRKFNLFCLCFSNQQGACYFCNVGVRFAT
jgi:hypothetical protein